MRIVAKYAEFYNKIRDFKFDTHVNVAISIELQITSPVCVCLLKMFLVDQGHMFPSQVVRGAQRPPNIFGTSYRTYVLTYSMRNVNSDRMLQSDQQCLENNVSESSTTHARPRQFLL